ncbi:MAG: hypothetical protein WC266_02845 [Patescibacteria group bacterium]|jgi:hypothetical protein
MKKILLFNALFLLVLAILIGIIYRSTDSSEPELITLSIYARGDATEPPPIADECLQRMGDYIEKSMELAREVEGGQSVTSCALVESRVGHSERDCGGELTAGGCSICKIHCYAP